MKAKRKATIKKRMKRQHTKRQKHSTHTHEETRHMTQDTQTAKRILAHQIVLCLDLWHDPDLGYDQINWTDEAPESLIKAFGDVVDYDGWRCAILRQYAWAIVAGDDPHAVDYEQPQMLDDQADWLKSDWTRPGYVEKAERTHNILASGAGLGVLFKKAQQLEIEFLIPQFDLIMDRLVK